MTAAIAIGVAWWITHEKKRGDQLALGMVLGGALGNIVDRVRFGYVVDFLDLHLVTFGPFLSLMSPTRRLASASSSCCSALSWPKDQRRPKETIEHA